MYDLKALYIQNIRSACTKHESYIFTRNTNDLRKKKKQKLFALIFSEIVYEVTGRCVFFFSRFPRRINYKAMLFW